MNFVLKEEDFLDGEPGNYTVTEKGEKYAEEQYHHRGVGGYSFYNRSWTTRTWDDGIADKLEITDDRKKEIRKAISIAKRKTTKSEDEGFAIDYNSYSIEGTDPTDTYNEALVEAVSALLVAVSAYGIYKATPYIKNWWRDKVVPSLDKIKNKITNKVDKNEDETEN